MWSNTATRFEDTRQRERELNDRQRRVLDLIEKGHTNREIADMLGMSVDGAKWNVSEILGKLALDSREDAAEYWRWRRSKTPAVMRAVRALFGVPAAKWVAGGAAAAAVGTTVAAVLLTGGQSGQTSVETAEGPGQPFYLEAMNTTIQPGSGSYETTTEADTAALRILQTIQESQNPDVPFAVRRMSNDGPPISRTAPVRWWFADPARWQWEQEVVPGFSKQTNADGTWVTSFPVGPDSYMKTELSAYSQRLDDGYTQMGMVGPTRATDLPELLAALGSAAVVGYEDVLGRKCTVIQLGPQGLDVGPGGTTYRGSGRVWLDEERMVIMRSEVLLGNGYEYHVEVTKLDWGYLPSTEELVFDPPPGASQLRGPAVQSVPPPGAIVELEP